MGSFRFRAIELGKAVWLRGRSFSGSVARSWAGAGAHPAEKVFCIGLNKTGTTSLEKALSDLGYRMGSQQRGEMLLNAWRCRDFAPIIKFAKTADAFQDIPFSLPFTYVALASTFRNAKFILSIRNSPEQWYESLVCYMINFFGGRPTAKMLMDCDYCYKGFMWESMYGVLALPDEDPLDRELSIGYYNAHNENVASFFREMDNFLQINLSDPDSYGRMCGFLGKDPVADGFPWLNRSRGL